MENVSETLVPLTQEIYTQLRGKIPEEKIEQVKDIIIRSLQYQELRNSSYQTSHQTLVEIRAILQPLQNWAQEEQELWKKIERLITVQAQEQATQRSQYFQKLDADLTALKQLEEQIRAEANSQPVAIEQQKIRETLASNLPKLGQILQDFSQFSQANQGLMESFGKNIADIQNRIAQALEPLQQQLQKMQQVSNQTIQDTVQKIGQELTQLQKQITDVTSTNWLAQIEALLREKYPLDKIQADLANIQKLFTQWQSNQDAGRQDWQTAQLTMRQEWQRVQGETFAEWERHQNTILNQIQQAPMQTQLLHAVQEVQQSLAGNKVAEIKSTVEQYQEVLSHIKKTVQQLQALPQQMHIPENFAVVIESIPDSIKKVRDYLEHFRQELASFGEHDLELLKANHEQVVEYTKLKATIIPEIQAMQQSWQKMSTRLDDYWSSSHETFSKNMSELASAISRIKLALEDLARYQQEDDKRLRPTSTLPETSLAEWKNAIIQVVDKAMQNRGTHNAAESTGSIPATPPWITSMMQDVRQEIRKEYLAMIPELKKEVMAAVGQEMRKDIGQLGQEMRKELAIVGQEMRKDISQAFGSLGESCAVALSKAMVPKMDALSGDIQSLEKRIADKVQILEQSIQSKIQLLEQTMQGKMQLMGQAIEQRTVTSPITNMIDTRINVKCPSCGRKVTAPLGFQGKRVQCQECRHEFIFPNLNNPK